MTVSIYDVVVDRSYRTVWYKLPFDRIVYTRDIPDRPLSREMTIDISLDSEVPTGGFTYVVITTKSTRDQRGYFIDDYQIFSANDSPNGVMRLTLSMDVWTTACILHSTQLSARSGIVPNSDIANGMYFVGENFESAWSTVDHYDAQTMNIMQRSVIVFSCTARSSSGAADFYYTVMSPPFNNYTEFQQWYNIILTADTLAFKITTDEGWTTPDGMYSYPDAGNRGFNKQKIQTIQAMALMPYPEDLEVNRSITRESWYVDANYKLQVTFRYYDLPATVGVGDQITNSTPRGWTILGNLLGSLDTFSTTASLFVVPTPRSWRQNWSVGQVGSGIMSPNYKMLIGNNGINVSMPAGNQAYLVADLTLTGGVQPVLLSVTINGEVLDLTPTLNLPFFTTPSRDQDEKNAQRWGLSVVSSVVSAVAQVATKNYVGAAMSTAQAMTTQRPQRSFSVTTGSGQSACVMRTGSTNTFIGCLTVAFLKRENGRVTQEKQNIYGDSYVGNCSYEFFWQRPPTNYETTGIFQLHNAKCVPLMLPDVGASIGIDEIPAMVERGVFFVNPEAVSVPDLSDGTYSFAGDPNMIL